MNRDAWEGMGSVLGSIIAVPLIILAMYLALKPPPYEPPTRTPAQVEEARERIEQEQVAERMYREDTGIRRAIPGS